MPDSSAAFAELCGPAYPAADFSLDCSAHLCGAWPGPLMEGPFAVGRCGTLATDIVTNPIEPEDGEVAIPATPGLGVELDMDRIAALRVDL